MLPVYLLIVAIVIIACILLNKVSSRLGIPMLLAFILLGMFFGSDGVVKIEFSNYAFTEQICSVALIFIMFYGGFGTKWSEAKPIAVKAILLSSVGVILTAAAVGVFCHFILGIEWLESLLIGSVIGSTDAASVFSILRSKRLNLRDRTASLLEMESGSNDPCAYMLTVVILAFMSGSVNGAAIAYSIFAQVVYGAAFGFAIAFGAAWVLKRFRFPASGFDAAFVLAVAILSYAAPAAVGGNGYLSAYLVGIYLGNHEIPNKRSLVNFFDGVTGLMQMLLFFLLGLLAFPSQMPALLIPSLLIFLFLTFVARPLSVFAVLAPFRSSPRQQLLVSWSGLRGAASIVFAVMVTVSPTSTDHDIFHIAFLIVLFSILLQGSLIPVLSKKLDMIDDDVDVLKTFSDYSDEVPIQYIQFQIPEGHLWVQQKISDILLPPNTILVLIRRGDANLTPHGKTVLCSGDILVLGAQTPDVIQGTQLVERRINKEDDWVGKRIAEMPKREGVLIVMILRNNQVVIPNGQVRLKAGDLLVLNRSGASLS